MTRFSRSLIIEAIVFALAMLAVAAWGCWASGQDAAVVPKPIPQTTAWQDEIQAELDRAGWQAAWQNKSVVVQVPAGVYRFVKLRIPAHVALVFGTGLASREADLIYVGGDDQTLIMMAGGYGPLLAGCQIRSQRLDAARLTALLVENCINPQLLNVRVDLRGVDTIGLDWRGRESLAAQNVELRAAVPLRYGWGDNGSFRNFDMGANGKTDQLPNTVVWIAGMPQQINFDGYQTWQGGNHAIWGEVHSNRSGQGLNLYNVRYEQSTSTGDASTAAIHLHFTGRSLESLLVIGSRWTDRQKGWDLRGVRSVTRLGGYLPGN